MYTGEHIRHIVRFFQLSRGPYQWHVVHVQVLHGLYIAWLPNQTSQWDKVPFIGYIFPASRLEEECLSSCNVSKHSKKSLTWYWISMEGKWQGSFVQAAQKIQIVAKISTRMKATVESCFMHAREHEEGWGQALSLSWFLPQYTQAEQCCGETRVHLCDQKEKVWLKNWGWSRTITSRRLKDKALFWLL